MVTLTKFFLNNYKREILYVVNVILNLHTFFVMKVIKKPDTNYGIKKYAMNI